MNKTCASCKRDFYVSPSRSHIKNCSYLCNKVWRKTNQINMKPLAVCGCGCGNKVKSHRAKYVYGHHPQPKIRRGLFKVGHKGMRQEDNPNWRGGFVSRNGYKMLTIDGKKQYIHRYVAGQTLGRKLKRTEQVHHINHDKLDNRPENLLVMKIKDHLSYHANVMWGKIDRMGEI